MAAILAGVRACSLGDQTMSDARLPHLTEVQPEETVAISMRDRVEMISTHLLSAAIIGVAAAVLLFVAGIHFQRPWVVTMALGSIGFGYLSQVLGANSWWNLESDALWAATGGAVILATFCWLAGFVLLFF